jgi:hypothetical protein
LYQRDLCSCSYLSVPVQLLEEEKKNERAGDILCNTRLSPAPLPLATTHLAGSRRCSSLLPSPSLYAGRRSTVPHSDQSSNLFLHRSASSLPRSIAQRESLTLTSTQPHPHPDHGAATPAMPASNSVTTNSNGAIRLNALRGGSVGGPAPQVDGQGQDSGEGVWKILSVQKSAGVEDQYLCYLVQGGKKVRVSWVVSFSTCLGTAGYKGTVRDGRGQQRAAKQSNKWKGARCGLSCLPGCLSVLLTLGKDATRLWLISPRDHSALYPFKSPPISFQTRS